MKTTLQTTSAEALASIEPVLGRLEKIVILALQRWGPSTCDELEVRLFLSHQCVSARLRGLAKRGKIEDSGERRPTRSGRSAIVWRIMA